MSAPDTLVYFSVHGVLARHAVVRYRLLVWEYDEEGDAAFIFERCDQDFLGGDRWERVTNFDESLVARMLLEVQANAEQRTPLERQANEMWTALQRTEEAGSVDEMKDILRHVIVRTRAVLG